MYLFLNLNKKNIYKVLKTLKMIIHIKIVLVLWIIKVLLFIAMSEFN